jgi:hypothetical protein
LDGWVPHSVNEAAALFAHAWAEQTGGSIMGRGILLWLLGVPIPIIILLALFYHH